MSFTSHKFRLHLEGGTVMNIEDYRYIRMIAEKGSLSAAAKELFISQPSLSQRVKYLEEYYGVTLFYRGARGINLTEEGRFFVDRISQILDIESGIQREFALRKDPGKSINIGTTQLVGSFIFDLLISAFHKYYNDRQFTFTVATSDELQKMILAGRLDIAVMYNVSNIALDENLTHQDFFNDRIMVIPAAGGSLHQKIGQLPSVPSAIDPDMLEGEAFALPPEDAYLHKTITKIMESKNITIDQQHTSKNYNILYTLAKNGIASTMLLESFFDPNMTYIPHYYLDSGDAVIPITLLWRKESYVKDIARNIAQIASKLFIKK